ncbi:hypothetical protein [Methyloceanibacter sp.]|uniref:hypothetical protein n=1 Tax=Methyloceanibacter sp. TaxID=1965321 RepID=UPI003567AD86
MPELLGFFLCLLLLDRLLVLPVSLLLFAELFQVLLIGLLLGGFIRCSLIRCSFLGTFGSRGEAQGRANRFGSDWFAMDTSTCPNMTNGYWIATAGPFDKATAQHYVNQTGSGYLKSCH